jgi:hypothetical protein
MAGLSNFISNTANQTTSMPTWYDQAQQNVVSQASTGASNVPTLQNTVAGGAINQLSNAATNPFNQAQSTLNQIGSGAANPWITNATTGEVSPNTNTAMGGLFQAQNQQLNQLMPNYTAPITGANVASGNFGSLRGETALNKARADAFAQLLPAQMQAALQNQQTGVQAATGQGQVGSQGVTSMTNLGQAQQSDPLFAASALGKIIGGINAPTTVSNTTNLSPLNQIGSIASALGGSISGTDKLLKQMGVEGGLSQYLKGIGINIGGGGSTGGGGTLPPTEGDNPDSGDYNGVDYGNTGPVLPPTEDDYLDSGDYNGVDYGGGSIFPPTEGDYLDSGDYNGVDYGNNDYDYDYNWSD